MASQIFKKHENVGLLDMLFLIGYEHKAVAKRKVQISINFRKRIQ
jgi:hypothetical protein